MRQVFPFASGIFVVFTMFAVVLGTLTGLLSWSPTAYGLWLTLPVTLMFPSLAEELIFRAPLLLARRPSRRIAALLWATAGFTLWHVVEALTFLPAGAPVLLRLDFLAIAAAFGVAATIVVLKTGRLWPAVMMHWVMVVGWKQLFSGPTLFAS